MRKDKLLILKLVIWLWGQSQTWSLWGIASARGTRITGSTAAKNGQQNWFGTPNFFPTEAPAFQRHPPYTASPNEEDDYLLSNRFGGTSNSLETDDINLTKLGDCVNHKHKESTEDSLRYHYSPLHKQVPTLTIATGDDTDCIQVFDKLNCEGQMSIQFLQVKEKSLKLRWNGNGNEREKLQNFNIFPSSVSKCPTKELDEHDLEFLREKYCYTASGFDIKLVMPGDTNTIRQLDYCVSVNKTSSKSNSFMTDLSLNLIRHKLESCVCVELYSEEECSGQVMRVMISPNPEASPHSNPPFKIWEYGSSKSGTTRFIDTDVNSMRKCSFCFHDSNNFHAKPAADSSNKVPFEHSSPKHEKLASDLDQSQSQATCQFTECKNISDSLQISNETILKEFTEKLSTRHCTLFFNDTSCSHRPIIKEEFNISILEQILSKYEKFAIWTIADCNTYKLGPLEECLAPLYPDKNLLDILPIGKFENLLHSKNSFKGYFASNIFITVSVSLAVIMLIIILIMGSLYWKKKRRLQAIRRSSIRACRGNGLIALAPTGTSGGGQLLRPLNVHQIDPVDENDYVSDITGLQALLRCFAADRFEIPRGSINIGNIRDSSATIIGMGEFSIAFRGKLEPSGRTIAVKTMKSGQATARSMKGVLKECQVFMMLGSHPGIVEFLGVCTEDVKKGELFVIMEYCENGPLKSFLMQNRNNFVNLVDADETIPVNVEMVEEARHSLRQESTVKFNTFQLFKWSYEVADAMEFLAVRKIVHVSLSTRNVLLDANYSCKICDFHLAKMPGENHATGYSTRTITNKLQERLVPWRWFAVESLMDDIFTTQSDAWTFGIFLWEVFTLGDMPYSDYHYGSEFTLCLKHGYRLLKPNLATINCYELMLICWFDAPEKRPNFSRIKGRLREMVPTTTTYYLSS